MSGKTKKRLGNAPAGQLFPNLLLSSTNNRIILTDNGNSSLLYLLLFLRRIGRFVSQSRTVYYQFAKSGIPRVYVIDKELVIRSVFTDNPLASYEDLAEAITASL